MKPTYKPILISFLALLIVSCGGGGGGGTPSTPQQPQTSSAPAATLIGIDVKTSADSRLVSVSESIKFYAVANYSDGSTGVPISDVTWTSESPSIAQVDNTGVVTGAALGTTTIYATKGSIKGSNTLGVTAPLTGFESISVGMDHVLAIKSDGTLWSWSLDWNGDAAEGELGRLDNTLIPKQVGTDTDWASVAAGYNRSFAIKKDGSLWAWGDNYQGMLGLNFTTSSVVTPTKIGAGYTSVATFKDQTIAISGGYLWGWGDNSFNELGIGHSIYTVTDFKTKPTPIGLNNTWSQVTMGQFGGFMLRKDGSAWKIDYKSNPIDGWLQVGLGKTWDRIANGNYIFGSLVDLTACPISAKLITIACIAPSKKWKKISHGGAPMLIDQDGKLWRVINKDGSYTSDVEEVPTTQPIVDVGGYLDNTLVVDTKGQIHHIDSSGKVSSPIQETPNGGEGKGPSTSVTASSKGSSVASSTKSTSSKNNSAGSSTNNSGGSNSSTPGVTCDLTKGKVIETTKTDFNTKYAPVCGGKFTWGTNAGESHGTSGGSCNQAMSNAMYPRTACYCFRDPNTQPWEAIGDNDWQCWVGIQQ